MRVLFVSSEIYPLTKTGGLADVSAALPAALAELGFDMRLVMPAYPQAIERAERLGRPIRLDGIPGTDEARIVPARTPDSGLPVWLIDCPALYRRLGGPYQDAQGRDWPDNALRFTALAHAAARLSDGDVDPGWRAEVVHANDWQTGLVPLLLMQRGARRPATLFTIHNMAFQGIFGAGLLPKLGVPMDSFSTDGIEFYGKMSFLKAGLRYSDHLTTVSPTYAREILTPEFGYGLEGLLQSRGKHITGILNGADYAVWDPVHDPHLPCQYSAQDMAGKRVCKARLQAELGLAVAADAPILAFLSRITHQKMADLVLDALPALLATGAQFVLLGDGEPELERRFDELGMAYPDQVAVRVGYEEALAHRVQAGADLLLHPSRFEPCGLVPIYALRYGTLPLVRSTGGLADIVTDATPQAIQTGRATGFTFSGLSTTDLVEAVHRALDMFRQPVAWRKLQRTAMVQDFGWAKPAIEYRRLYHELCGRPIPAEALPSPDPAIAAQINGTIGAG
jgi:starch synthase